MAEVVVVTGATSGVGRAVVERFAREGAHIALLARGRDGLDATVEAVERLGGKAIPFPTDVSDPDAVEAGAAAPGGGPGPVDGRGHNAVATGLPLFPGGR